MVKQVSCTNTVCCTAHYYMAEHTICKDTTDLGTAEIYTKDTETIEVVNKVNNFVDQLQLH